jgi:hypothetical protein
MNRVSGCCEYLEPPSIWLLRVPKMDEHLNAANTWMWRIARVGEDFNMASTWRWSIGRGCKYLNAKYTWWRHKRRGALAERYLQSGSSWQAAKASAGRGAGQRRQKAAAKAASLRPKSERRGR